MNVTKPKIIFWTAILLSLAGSGTLALHIALTRRGVIDVSSYFQGTLFLVSGLILFFRPRWKPAFYLASAALLIFSIRGFVATYAMWQGTGQLGLVPMPLMIAVLLSMLTIRFYCSLPVRLYFGIVRTAPAKPDSARSRRAEGDAQG